MSINARARAASSHRHRLLNGSCVRVLCRAYPPCVGILRLPGYPALRRNPAVIRVPCPASESCGYQGTLPCVGILPLPGYPALRRNPA
eukprot:1176567-Prorocentrum_minimum.AAC.1